MERLERLALVLHIFKISSLRLISMLDSLSSFNSFNDKFKLACGNEELSEADLYIDYDTCFRASLLTKYYLQQMKILAGYDPYTDVFFSNKKSKHIPNIHVNEILNHD